MELKQIKKLVGLVAVSVPLLTFADTKTVDGITWTYKVSNDEVSIYSGWRSSAVPNPSGAITIPSTLGGKPVTSIGDYAFYKCDRITSVMIPNSVTSIGGAAFQDCSGLTSVTIPNSVTNIGVGAFHSCENLTNVTIPNSVTSIKGSAFHSCENLTNVTIPNSVTSIGDSAFYSCKNLTSVTIPDSVTNIGACAFLDCNKLSAVYITNIAAWCRINFGGSWSPSESNPLAYAHNLYLNGVLVTDVTIPDDVTRIERGTFCGCTSLTSVTIPESVTSIGSSAFYRCENLTSVAISSGVTSIGGATFSCCSGLTSVTIPDSVTSIDVSTFYGCTSLTSVTIPNNVTSIGEYAFDGCSGLTSVVIPNKVKSIGKQAFMNCSALTNVVFEGKAPSVGNDTFSGVNQECKGIISRSASGWGTRISRQWNGLLITYPWYRFEFDAVGGNCTEESRIVNQGCALGDLPTPERTGYEFAGWYTDDDGGDCIQGNSVLMTDTRLYAHWTPCRYLVTFDANGGVGGTSENMAYESAIVVPTVTRMGYTFDGWLPSVVALVPLGGATYTAQWEINQYTVTFDANGGIGSTSRNQDYDTAIVAPTVMRTGHTFAGWSPSVAATVPASNVTYTAQWEINQYTVAFDANGGVGGTSGRQNYGTAIVAPTVTRTGYTFKDWSPSVATTVPATDVTYTAQWEINQYTVTFDANGGIGSTSGNQDYGTSIVVPTVTRTGYTFKGWSPSVAATVPANDVTYTAQWEINKYAVTFNANGGEGGTSVNQDYGTAIVAPAVTRSGYTFKGWSPSVAATVPANDVTYTAQWEINQYTVTFDANGGIGSTSGNQDYGTSIVVPTVTRTGYTFKGWSPSVAATVPANDVTYTAQWEINKYTVTFDANGGVGGKSVRQNYDTAIVAPTVTRTGYTFKGWSPSVDATVPANDVTHTAQWEINKYTVRFDYANGGGARSTKQNYGTAIVAPTVTRTGYTFKGWSPAVDATVPAHDVTYTAQWEINQYTVTFDANGGTGGRSRELEYESTLVAPIVTRTGYTFKGWLPSVPATVPLGGATYTAQWEINQYTVTFDANGGVGGTSTIQDYGTEVVVPTVTWTGYTFMYWSPSVAATVPASDVTYKALWKVNQYAVTFVVNGEGFIVVNGKLTPRGTNIVQICDYGTEIVAPTVTRTGYTLEWSPSVDATVPTHDVTYTTQWQINQYTVTFDANGGIGGTSMVQDYGTDIVVPTVTRTGYTFKGWSPSVSSRVPARNVQYTAQWEINKYAVTFDAGGGTCDTESLTIAHGAALGDLPVPTRAKAVFLGWFTGSGMRVNELTTVTGPVILYAHWLTEVANPVVTTDWGSLVFRTNSCVVSISCATEGTSIYYTDDGTTPKKNDNYLYTEPFTITDTTTIKAVAVIGDIQSEYVTVTITKKQLTLEEALDVGEGMSVATSAEFPWTPILDATAKIGDATARSGEIGNRTNTWLSATVSGEGTMSFWCKVSCEHDEDNTFTWDRLMVYTNGVEIMDWRMDGETDWTQRTLTFAGGENTVKWVYYKDKSDADGEDCAWVDGIEWTPSAEAMLAAWLVERNLTADAMAANGRTAAECYALGLDPTLATNDFRIVSIEMVDGKPKVEWEPKVNRWTGAEIQAVLKGAATLEGEWKAVEGATAAEKASMRFFKVVVEVQ